MKYLAFLLFLVLSAGVHGQETKPAFDGHTWEAPYLLPVPENWTTERFEIPVSFAPQIAYKGVEDIRFAPGWGKAKSEAYWSYVFLWWLDGKINMDAETIEKNLAAYYTGLITINGENIPAVKRIAVTSFKKIKGATAAFTGTIKMMDYLQQSPITLQCKVYVETCAGKDKTFIFYEVSPQPSAHPVWAQLDAVRTGFKCTK